MTSDSDTAFQIDSQMKETPKPNLIWEIRNNT